MDYVFVDETGEPSSGGTPYFGMALLHISDNNYEGLRQLLSQVHWLCGTAKVMTIKRDSTKALNLLRGLKELAKHGILSASALYIKKEDYGGLYLRWSELNIPQNKWPYFLRNYLLRHLLEFHFTSNNMPTSTIDLVLDRVALTIEQRDNTHNYLNSRTTIPLNKPFNIPHIQYLTITDSEYTGGLEVAHILCDVLKRTVKGIVSPTQKELSNFMRIRYFVGHKEGDL